MGEWSQRYLPLSSFESSTESRLFRRRTKKYLRPSNKMHASAAETDPAMMAVWDRRCPEFEGEAETRLVIDAVTVVDDAFPVWTTR